MRNLYLTLDYSKWINPLSSFSRCCQINKFHSHGDRFRKISVESKNIIMNNESNQFSVELKVRMAVGNYWLPVVTGGAEPGKGGGIAQAWIADPKV